LGFVPQPNLRRILAQSQTLGTRGKAPRPLAEIDAELAGVEQRILDLLREVTE